jgi:hypothetical protein
VRGANRAHIAAGPGADDDDVEGGISHCGEPDCFSHHHHDRVLDYRLEGIEELRTECAIDGAVVG